MKLRLLTIGLILASHLVNAQSEKDCAKLLDKEISVADLNENIELFLTDFKTLINCEFDEIDEQIFMGPNGNMPLIGTALVNFAGRAKNNEKYTFDDLKAMLLSFKEKPEYVDVRTIVEAQNTIIEKEALIENWKEDKVLLQKMGLDADQCNEMYTIVSKNEGKPYAEIFVLYADVLDAKKEKEIIENQKKLEALKQQHPKSVEWITGLIAYESYDLGLEKSKELHKPMLLYFNGYACVNARKMEHNILGVPEIQDAINTNFVFVSLLVDDKRKLEESETYDAATQNKRVETVGQKNSEIQKIQFNSNSQPLFVVIDQEGNELARMGYTNDVNAFLDFINIIKKD